MEGYNNQKKAICSILHITFHVDKLRHIAEAKIHAPNLPKNGIFAEAESEDMYKTVDLFSRQAGQPIGQI